MTLGSSFDIGTRSFILYLCLVLRDSEAAALLALLWSVPDMLHVFIFAGRNVVFIGHISLLPSVGAMN